MLRPVEHQLSIDLKPHRGTLTATDRLTLYPGKWEASSFVFLLHGEFEVEPVEIPHNGKWAISREKIERNGQALHKIEIVKPSDAKWPDFVQLTFRYKGPYRDLQSPANPVVNASETRTLFFGESSYFYPVIDSAAAQQQNPLLIFEMQTVTSPGWEVVSEGKRITHIGGEGRIATVWKCDDPMEEIHLITDQYHEYSGRWEDIDLMVFLKDKDPALAERYIEAARLYIPFYQRLIGHYPFVKLAVVENSEQTGYGMPSFTLLGSQVIRFPFILHTSFPHEILHNWWGNGVYVDGESGNWSEGLTTYLADHLFPDLEGKGDRYRFQELMKYKNYVPREKDFPLSRFVSRTDEATQAVGYGKLVLVLHMLRQKIGDRAFLNGLHEFYFNNLFQRAGFDDLRIAMEEASQTGLAAFFKQWVQTQGAPQLELGPVSVKKGSGGFQIDLEIRQVQEGDMFDLDVPAALWLEGRDAPLMKSFHLPTDHATFSETLSGKPRAVQIDPRHEVFRLLNPGEVPPSVSQTYGDTGSLIVLPHAGTTAAAPYERFAQSLAEVADATGTQDWKKGAHSVWWLDKKLPGDSRLTGWLNDKGVIIEQDRVLIGEKSFSRDRHSVVLTLPHPENPDRSLTWVSIHSDKAVPGLARKLPHYGKYGYLVFEGDEPVNVAKGLWPSNPQGLVHRFDSGPLPLPETVPLVDYRPGDPLE